ncbi:MAG: ATP-binding cassette domain-containing protein [Caulobacteraceae bacterium]|nr:ATP-binding cassette domain-containing protein [Caulobacter sp.]
MHVGRADPPAIRLTGVVKRYAAGALALNGVDLEAPAGAFLALVGASGSGKTTLLKTINRLSEPDAGMVELWGEDARAGPAFALRRRIGYAFQDVGLFPHLSVGENIALPLRLAGRPRAQAPGRVAELLALVDLPPAFAARMPDQLSGGQRQRVGVARALAAEPRLMLMDEPFGALDPATREALGDAYRTLHDRLGLTTVMVTHDVQEAILLADRIVVMREGAVVADAAPVALMAGHPDPFVAALMAAPRRAAERVAAIAEGAPRG